MKRFNKFCTRFNVSLPFPVTEDLLCSFAAFLAEDGLAPQTYLSAIRNTQISLGFPEQSAMARLKRVLAGIRRVRSRTGPPS